MISNILFDFDGVILNSMPFREIGFRLIFKEFEKDKVDSLIEYHNQNGGLSRYNKINFFFEEILKVSIEKTEVDSYANSFSKIMKKELINKKYLVNETLVFLRKNFKRYNLHIVSGSDESELQYLCKQLDIAKYFLSIYGSPMTKSFLVNKVISENNYLVNETLLIGDSINDLEAAAHNGIKFYGYNNLDLMSKSDVYLKDYMELT